MSPSDPPKHSETNFKPGVIPYALASDTRSGPRRWWVYAVLGIYLLLFAALLTAPLWMVSGNDLSSGIAVAVIVTLLTLCGLALLLTPVRARRRRPMTRRSILIPIVASGFLLGGLVLGGGFAVAELCAPARGEGNTGIEHVPADSTLWMIAAAAVAVWIAWSVVFGLIARGRDPTSLGMKLHRILIAGSVLELLVAVPAHIIVRRRNECCAGYLTGMGICIGVAIALVCFGPTVLLLYQKRRRQIRQTPTSDRPRY